MFSEMTNQQKLVLAIGGVFFLGVGIRVWTRGQDARRVVASGGAEERVSDEVSERGVTHTFIFERAPMSIKRLLSDSGIISPRVPSTLKVVLDMYDFTETETRQVRFFWDAEAVDNARSGWVPASMIKVFAAVGALQRLSEDGFGAGARVTFFDTNQTTTIEDLINKSIIQSDNMSYNRLVQLAGHQRLYETLLKEFSNTELNKPYIVDEWVALTGGNNTFASPRIRVEEGGGSIEYAPAPNRGALLCKGVSACTTLSEMNNLMARVVLFRDLGISEPLEGLLLSALGAKKGQGQSFSNAMVEQINSFAPSVYDKHGFNGEWYSQTVVILSERRDRAFVISAVGHRGDRSILNDLGRALGQLISSVY